MKLEGGIGLSLINKVPEELVFASLTGINVHYTQLATSHMLELSVQDVQVRRGGSELVHLPVFSLKSRPDPVVGVPNLRCLGRNILGHSTKVTVSTRLRVTNFSRWRNSECSS